MINKGEEMNYLNALPEIALRLLIITVVFTPILFLLYKLSVKKYKPLVVELFPADDPIWEEVGLRLITIKKFDHGYEVKDTVSGDSILLTHVTSHSQVVVYLFNKLGITIDRVFNIDGETKVVITISKNTLKDKNE